MKTTDEETIEDHILVPEVNSKRTSEGKRLLPSLWLMKRNAIKTVVKFHLYFLFILNGTCYDWDSIRLEY